MEAVPTDDGPFGTKFYQMGIYTPDFDGAISTYEEMGWSNWQEDRLTHHARRARHDSAGNLIWQPYQIQAYLCFNYDVVPMELELLACFNADHQQCDGFGEPVEPGKRPYLHHMCARVDDIKQFIGDWSRDEHRVPESVFVSSNHTNPSMVDNHRVAGAYYDTVQWLGYKVKVVQRIDWDSTLSPTDLLAGMPVKYRP